jgi:hypothetical protein
VRIANEIFMTVVFVIQSSADERCQAVSQTASSNSGRLDLHAQTKARFEKEIRAELFGTNGLLSFCLLVNAVSYVIVARNPLNVMLAPSFTEMRVSLKCASAKLGRQQIEIVHQFRMPLTGAKFVSENFELPQFLLN